MMKQLTRLMVLGLVGLACVMGAGCVLDILGPRDKPDFTGKGWKSLEVKYWYYTTASTNSLAWRLASPEDVMRRSKHATPGTPYDRTFTITNQETLTQLCSAFHVTEIRGLSIGSGGEFVLEMGDGEIWDGSIVFEDRVHIAKRVDNWYSYSVDLEDYDFFNALLALCAENEKQFHPEATEKHIRLRSNINRKYTVFEHVEAVDGPLPDL